MIWSGRESRVAMGYRLNEEIGESGVQCTAIVHRDVATGERMGESGRKRRHGRNILVLFALKQTAQRSFKLIRRQSR